MSEQTTFEIGTTENDEFVEGLIFYGDERGEDYPKWRLTNLEGWDMPNYERISVPDPNGGNYVDSHVTKLGKIVTLNFSVFFKNDSDGFDALKKCAEDFASEELRTLRKTTIFSDSTVVEILEGCYKINEISVVKKTGEYRFTISFGSTNYALSSGSAVVPELVGGPFNAKYTSKVDDPRNWEGPRYVADNDPNNPAAYFYDPDYDYSLQAKEYLNQDGKPYTKELDDPRNINKDYQGNFYDNLGDPNNPAGWAYNPNYILTAKYPLLIGGPYNAEYTLSPMDDRNFNRPTYNPDYDPNNPAAFNYGYKAIFRHNWQ